jgi:hypothetical protein
MTPKKHAILYFSISFPIQFFAWLGIINLHIGLWSIPLMIVSSYVIGRVVLKIIPDREYNGHGID